MIQLTNELCNTPPQHGELSQNLSPFKRAVEILRDNQFDAVGLSYVLGFPTAEGISVAQRNTDKHLAVTMLVFAHTGVSMRRQFDRFLCNGSQDRSPSQVQAIKAGRSMLRRLRRTGVGFVMVWRVTGLPGVRLDYSRDINTDLVQHCLATMANGVADPAIGFQ